MAHFAEIDQNNIVKRVIVVNNDVITDENGNENEQTGVNFCKSLFGEDTNWVQTSYNASFRNIYAAEGYTYDQSLDAFILPQPYPSWAFNTETLKWDPPVPEPQMTEDNLSRGEYYAWDEENQTWNLKSLNSPVNL